MIAEEQHLEHDLARQVAGEDRRDDHRPDAHIDLRCAEGGGLGCNEQVTGAGQPEAARQRVAVDAPDDRLAEIAQELKEIDQAAPAMVPLDLGLLGVEGRQVGARAEGLVPRAGQDDHSHLRFQPAPAESRQEVPEHLGREWVALVWLVERDRGDVLSELDQDGFQLGNRAHGYVLDQPWRSPGRAGRVRALSEPRRDGARARAARGPRACARRAL